MNVRCVRAVMGDCAAASNSNITEITRMPLVSVAFMQAATLTHRTTSVITYLLLNGWICLHGVLD